MKTDKQAIAPTLEELNGVLRQIGQYLRDSRLARGEDIYDIAEYLRIRPSYLHAIEEGDINNLPGSTYVIGFLRSYSDYLGCETQAVIDEARSALSVAPAALAVQPKGKEPETGSRGPAAKIVALSAAAAVAMVVAWQVQDANELLPSNLAELPSEISDAVGTYLAGGVGEITGSQEPTQELASAVQQVPSAAILPDVDTERLSANDRTERSTIILAPPRGDASSAIAAEPSMLTSSEESELAEAASPQPQSAIQLLAALQAGDQAARSARTAIGADESDTRVVLVAVEKTWIQVKSASRDYVRTRTLLAGERMTLPDREDLSLWTGNAGGLQIIVDGETLGAPGAGDEVVKDLSLAPLKLKQSFDEGGEIQEIAPAAGSTEQG